MLLAGRKGYVPSRRAGRGKGSGSGSREEVSALQEAERGIPQPSRTTTMREPSDTMRSEQEQQQPWCAGQDQGRRTTVNE